MYGCMVMKRVEGKRELTEGVCVYVRERAKLYLWHDEQQIIQRKCKTGAHIFIISWLRDKRVKKLGFVGFKIPQNWLQ